MRNGNRVTNIDKEIMDVLNADPNNGKVQKDGRIADFYMLRNNIEYYFEIKTVKPNIDVFTKSKSKLLEWVARRRKKIKVYLAFPYNPYHPKPYERFTLQGLLTPGKDFLIGEDFWDLLGGPNSLKDILKIFDKVGKSFKDKISEKISEVANTKMKL